jgi:hypothetical protein
MLIRVDRSVESDHKHTRQISEEGKKEKDDLDEEGMKVYEVKGLEKGEEEEERQK